MLNTVFFHVMVFLACNPFVPCSISKALIRQITDSLFTKIDVTRSPLRVCSFGTSTLLVIRNFLQCYFPSRESTVTAS